jgi:hypothetical protein
MASLHASFPAALHVFYMHARHVRIRNKSRTCLCHACRDDDYILGHFSMYVGASIWSGGFYIPVAVTRTSTASMHGRHWPLHTNQFCVSHFFLSQVKQLLWPAWLSRHFATIMTLRSVFNKVNFITNLSRKKRFSMTNNALSWWKMFVYLHSCWCSFGALNAYYMPIYIWDIMSF